jgi:hypothetical protein
MTLSFSEAISGPTWKIKRIAIPAACDNCRGSARGGWQAAGFWHIFQEVRFIALADIGRAIRL